MILSLERTSLDLFSLCPIPWSHFMMTLTKSVPLGGIEGVCLWASRQLVCAANRFTTRWRQRLNKCRFDPLILADANNPFQIFVPSTHPNRNSDTTVHSNKGSYCPESSQVYFFIRLFGCKPQDNGVPSDYVTGDYRLKQVFVKKKINKSASVYV